MAQKKDSDPIIGGKTLSIWQKTIVSGPLNDRIRAIKDLGRLGKRALKALPLLVCALEDHDSNVQACALEAIVGLDVTCPGTVGPTVQVALPKLQELLEDGDERIPYVAAVVLGSIGPAAAAAAPQMAKLMARSGEVEASWMSNSLAKLGPAAVPHLTALLRSRKLHVRGSAVFALGELGPPAADAVPEILKTLTDKAPARTYAVAALGQIASNAKLAVPALIRMLSDEDNEVRRAAVKSLGQFGPAAAKAVPKLIPLLGANDWSLWQFLAAEALGRIGPAASSAIGPLQDLLTSEEKHVREESQNAIRLISGTPMPLEEVEKRRKPGPGDTVFDFARTKEVVTHMIKEGIARFSKEHSDEDVACVALFSRGFSAFACLCIGTPADVPIDLKHGGAYDFKYSEYGHEDFEWWPDLYKVGASFTILLPDGRKMRRSTDKNGNDAIDKPLFKLLTEALTEALPFRGLRLSKGFRVGVEMHDSSCVKFWSPK